MPRSCGQTIAEFHKLAEDEVKVAGIVRNENRSAKPLPDAVIRENDLLLLEGEPLALERVVTSTGLKLSREHRRPEAGEALDEIGVIEAVIGPGSVLIGQTAERMALYERFHVNLIAVSRARRAPDRTPAHHHAAAGRRHRPSGQSHETA